MFALVHRFRNTRSIFVVVPIDRLDGLLDGEAIMRGTRSRCIDAMRNIK